MNQPLKSAINKAMKDNDIYDKGDAEKAISFVEDLLIAIVKDTETNEPYATISIQEMKMARKRVWDLIDYIEESQ